MPALLRCLLPTLLLACSFPARGDVELALAPSAGVAWISNLNGYDRAVVGRLDLTWQPSPVLGAGAFGAIYSPFRAGSGAATASVGVEGVGAGVTATWPLRPEIQPYLRLEYLLWWVHASGYGRTLADARGGSPGLAVGLRLATGSRLGVRMEAGGYRRISGADLRQVTLALVLAL